MSADVWNLLSGYVIIEVKGSSIERFLNQAYCSGVDIFDVRRTGEDSISASTSVRGFYALHSLSRGKLLKIRILKKRGLIIALSRLRFRKVLLFGWVFVLAALLGASRYVWFIDIGGCDAVDEAEVAAMLGELGVTAGALRSEISTYDVGRRVMAADPRISFASARLDGVLLTLDIVETEKIELEPETSGASSIFAKKDGVVCEVTTKRGKTLVRPGEAVRAGDELISGMVRNDETGSIFVEASGAVYANVMYRFSASAGPLEESVVRTGERREKCGVSLLGIQMGEPVADEDGCETVMERTVVLAGCVLPVRIDIYSIYGLKRVARTLPREELEKMAVGKAEALMRDKLDKTAVLLSKETELQTNDDGSVRAIITVTAKENIGIVRSIDGERIGQEHADTGDGQRG